MPDWLKEKMEGPAEKIDACLHHEVLPNVPGELLIEPELDFGDIDWKNPTLKDMEYGIEIKYEIRF